MVTLLMTLAVLFFELSLLSFGGGNTILPEMQRQVVEIHHWMTAQQFSASFALAQAAPGPNMMIVSLLGWRIAGCRLSALGAVQGSPVAPHRPDGAGTDDGGARRLQRHHHHGRFRPDMDSRRGDRRLRHRIDNDAHPSARGADLRRRRRIDRHGDLSGPAPIGPISPLPSVAGGMRTRYREVPSIPALGREAVAGA